MGDKWHRIATHLPGRTAKQCRQKAQSHGVLMYRKKKGWSISEDETLASLQGKIGNKWTTIAASIPGRTVNDVKVRGRD